MTIKVLENQMATELSVFIGQLSNIKGDDTF